jgi:hypothetical protein
LYFLSFLVVTHTIRVLVRYILTKLNSVQCVNKCSYRIFILYLLVSNGAEYSLDVNMFSTYYCNREHAMKLLEENWEETAPRVLGIPVHPLGELSAFGYIFYNADNMETIRLRTLGIIIPSFFHTVLLIIFTYNAFKAIQHLRNRRYNLMAWCCIIQSLTGIIYCSITLSSALASNGASCRVVLWTAAIGVPISSICVSIALLQQAYFAHGCNKKLLIIGIIMIMPLPAISYIVMTTPVIAIDGMGCALLYSISLPWIKFALEAPINTVFSIAFIIVVYRQYRLRGKKAWKHLTRTGIRTFVSIILCNFICMLAAAMDILGIVSELFFVLDWVITSSLLIHHCLSIASVIASARSTSSKKLVSKSITDAFIDTETMDISLNLDVTYRRLALTTQR